jgi:hypothetical protein
MELFVTPLKLLNPLPSLDKDNLYNVLSILLAEHHTHNRVIHDGVFLFNPN